MFIAWTCCAALCVSIKAPSCHCRSSTDRQQALAAKQTSRRVYFLTCCGVAQASGAMIDWPPDTCNCLPACCSVHTCSQAGFAQSEQSMIAITRMASRHSNAVCRFRSGANQQALDAVDTPADTGRFGTVLAASTNKVLRASLHMQPLLEVQSAYNYRFLHSTEVQTIGVDAVKGTQTSLRDAACCLQRLSLS